MFYHLGGFRILVDPKQRVVCCLNLGVGTATWGLEEVWERDAKPAAWQKKHRPFPASRQKMKAYPAGWHRLQVTRAT